MAQFPSSIISFTTKVNGQVIDASDVNTPQSEITALETKVGVDNSADTTTIDYLVKNAASNGGGHVQTANKGGTGQTSYNKGDLLVASSSSVLSKLAVGADGLVLAADSTQSTGLKYAAVATAAQIQNLAFSYARGSVMSASVYGVNLSQAVSVLSDGLALAVKFPTTNVTSVLALSVNAQGPSSVAARIKNTDGTNPIVGAIQASMIGEVVFDSVSSVFQLQNTYIPTYGVSSVLFLRNDATWGSVPSTTKLNINTTSSILTGTASETTIYSTSVPGGTLATSNGIKGRISFTYTKASGSATTFKLIYGSTTVASASATSSGAGSFTFTGFIDFELLANASTSAQKGTLVAWGSTNELNSASVPATQMYISATGTSAENSTGALTLSFSVTQNSAGDSWTTNHASTQIVQ